MTTVAHTISGSLIALAATNTLPQESNYLLLSLASASFLDLDHVFSMVKNKKFYRENGWQGNLHNARTFLHELAGFFVIGVCVWILGFVDIKAAKIVGIASMVHLTQDIIMGVSIPFGPFQKLQMMLLPQKTKIKVLADIFLVVLFSILWLGYLNATK